MKLYHFNPNEYGEEYFVMSNNKTEAHKSLLNFFENKITNDLEYENEWNRSEYERWKNVNPEDSTTFPDKYTLDEYEENKIIQTELA